MRVIIQKFGGTSVATRDLRLQVLQHIKLACKEGFSPVVVVSAMGRLGEPYATDTLLALANNLKAREQDLLLHCGEIISACALSSLLNEFAIANSILTGGQAGVVTTDDFGCADLLTINTKRIYQELKAGKVVIVTGFQGQTTDGEITTLGRGGSDTSATALGSALQAEYVDIFTDVEGIMTADPRIVEDALPLKRVTYTEICNLAFQGAKVIHPHAVEIAMLTNIPIRVRSTMSMKEGTLVVAMHETDVMSGLGKSPTITGIAQMPNMTQIKIKAKKEQLDIQKNVFKAMADHGISVDFINVNPSGIAYTISDDVAAKAEDILSDMDLQLEITPHCAKVSIVGAGIAGVPGVMARIMASLTEQDIQILQSADSHTTIWVLVHGNKMDSAVRALHHAFRLHEGSTI